jgi:hypothetical protein
MFRKDRCAQVFGQPPKRVYQDEQWPLPKMPHIGSFGQLTHDRPVGADTDSERNYSGSRDPRRPCSGNECSNTNGGHHSAERQDNRAPHSFQETEVNNEKNALI